MGFKLGSEKRQIRTASNTSIIRKDLDDGVLGEANMDGSIYIDKNIPTSGEMFKRTIRHEMKHKEDIEKGRKAKKKIQHMKDTKRAYSIGKYDAPSDPANPPKEGYDK